MAPPVIDSARVELLEKAAAILGGKANLGRALGYRDGAFVGQMIRGERPVTEKTLALMRSIHALHPLFSGGQAAPAPSPSPPDLAAALPVVLDALCGLPLARAVSVRAQLDQVMGHPEMRDDVLAELQALLQSLPGKRQAGR